MHCASAGLRPHFLFGTKELATKRPPKSLPPMRNAHFHRYDPEKGCLTCEDDRPRIQAMTARVREGIRDVQASYVGGRDEHGEMHGMGKQTFEDGAEYSGYFQHGKMHGSGIYRFSDFRVYEGQFQNGMKHGQGMITFADGGVCDGQWSNDKRNGFNVLTYPDGVTAYSGNFLNDVRHGRGLFVFADGTAPQNGFFEKGQFVRPLQRQATGTFSTRVSI